MAAASRGDNKRVIHANILYNDRIAPSDEAVLRPGQLGLLAGWGVFTTLRIYKGIPFAFEYHWERLQRDARLLHVEIPIGRDELRMRLLELVRKNQCPEASMRLCIVRSQGGVFEGPGSGNRSDVVAFTVDVPRRQETVSLAIRPNGRYAESPFAGTKTLSWAHNLTFVETARRQGFGEVVLLNERGEAAECTSANIFAVRGGCTYTPPLTSGPLPGITRLVMLNELAEAVEERVLYPADLYEADEVFITSTVRELLPVERIADRRLKAADRGEWPVMEKLRGLLRRYIEAYTEQHL